MPSREPAAPFLVGFTAYKGGTGKSTVAFNVGLEFARYYQGFDGVPRRPVVFFDLDPQGRSDEGGRTLKKMFEDGPFRLRSLHSPIPELDVQVVEYDPDEPVPVDGVNGSFGSYGLVDSDASFAPALLAVPKNIRIRRVKPLRRLLAAANELLFQYLEDRGSLDSKLREYLSSPPLGVVDTPPMNAASDTFAGILTQVDLVIPVVDPENVRQLSLFCKLYVTRLAVVNRVPPDGLTREAKFFDGVLNRILNKIPLNKDEVVKIPERPVIRFASALGIPVRARPDKRHSGYFREVARHIRADWNRRRYGSGVRI
ncbi:ParA family protein [Methanopyrus kandleri]|uniref:ParA family protein n=1 Tax=Methanopyrus kandleri TaxID=2320 RepID=A0A832TGY0_9EURY|nr:ParA family protein [Methanopyrus kandleri]HII70544.1 ParA family protein [Methanopyrus kandleri]